MLTALLAALLALTVAGGLLFWTNPPCASLPGSELLPNADFALDADGNAIPDGWRVAVAGPARLAADSDYTVTGQGRSMQLIGLANSLQTPPVAVVPGTNYCFVAQALADQAPAPTRLQLRFGWLDSAGSLLAEQRSAWLPVKTPAGGGWSLLRASANAPTGSTQLVVSLHPASDDRIYLDELHLRRGGASIEQAQPVAKPHLAQEPVALGPWPDGRRAAVSFSFDWETTMGGLIHSRSAGDPNVDQDPIMRGLRMRQGITETLRIFAPFGVRATYYATGYNFLSGNRERREFMGDPTYAWATPAQRWRRDWSQRPWFGDDPYSDNGDVATQGAAWYFGDLIAPLRAAGQDIQSHTFSHFYGGFVGPDDWRSDLAAWREVAAPYGVRGPQSVAFPWSSSGGMSYASWQVLAEEGVTALTRLSDQPQYQLFDYVDEVPVAPRCVPLPGHEEMLACPDVYLTPGARETKALQAIDAALAAEGTVDIWAHTEEVTSPEQIAAWQRVVAYAATNTEVWVAPLVEIADWQRALQQVQVERVQAGEPYRVTIKNGSERLLEGVTLNMPFAVRQAQAASNTLPVRGQTIVLTLAPGQTAEVLIWPA